MPDFNSFNLSLKSVQIYLIKKGIKSQNVKSLAVLEHAVDSVW